MIELIPFPDFNLNKKVNNLNKGIHNISISKNPGVVASCITSLETALVHIINQVIETDNDISLQWLAANKDRIYEIFRFFDDTRKRNGCERILLGSKIIDNSIQTLNEFFSSKTRIFGSDTKSSKNAAYLNALVYGKMALATSVAATAISATSFTAGPGVGIPVTVLTGTIGFFSSIGIATYAGIKGANNAESDIKKSLREIFMQK